MKAITAYAIKRPVTVIIGILMALVLGVISFTNIKTDLLPNMNLPYAVVITTYQGANPETVELEVSRPIEQTVAGINNIKNITSISYEHYSIVVLEFNTGVDINMAAIDLRDSLDMLSANWNSEIGSPMIMKINPNMMPIMTFTISQSDKTISEQVNWYNQLIIPEIEKISGVASVNVGGIPKEEIVIDISQAAIDIYNQQLLAVIQTINGSITADSQEYKDVMINKSKLMSFINGANYASLAGTVEISGVTYYVRAGATLNSIADIENVEFTPTFANNPLIPLKAKINDFIGAEGIQIMPAVTKSYYKVNGADAVTFEVQKNSDVPTTEVTRAVAKKLADLKNENDNIQYRIISNQGEYIDSSINGIFSNLIIGGLLAIFILFLFIRNLKINLTIALAIPLSLIVAFVMIYFSGITLNIISMAGLALGVGMLVDNSIVVIENIYRLKNDEGKSIKDAAMLGASEMIGAIMASTLTTICVFVPILFVKGLIVSMFEEMALTITFSLLASLIVAIAVVPVMAIHIKEIEFKKSKSAQKPEKEKTFEVFKNKYLSLLKKSLKYRKRVLAGTVALFLLSAFAMTTLEMTLMPSSDEGQININLLVEEDEEYNDVINRIELFVDKLQDKANTEIAHYIEEISVSYSQEVSASMSLSSLSSGSGATIGILLTNNRKHATSFYAQEARDIASQLGYKYSVSDSSGMISMISSDTVAFTIQGHDINILENYARDIAAIMASTPGLDEIDDGSQKGSKELVISINETGISYGLSNEMIWGLVAQTINAQYPTGVMTLDSKEYTIRIAGLENPTYSSIEDIKNIMLLDSFPLGLVADVEFAYGYSSIMRQNQVRTITVSAVVEPGFSASGLTSQIKKEINKIDFIEGYSLYESGTELMNETFNSLLTVVVLAIILVFLIMAAQFQSFKFPFIVMMTFPLAFTGAIAALLFTMTPMSAPALIGMIILVGIVVNSGIVLVDSINQNKEKGMGTTEAILTSAANRFRPILMTSITTILAMMTMAIGIGDNSEFYKPIGISAVGGLLYATLLTLFIVPIFYSIFDRKGMKKDKIKLND